MVEKDKNRNGIPMNFIIFEAFKRYARNSSFSSKLRFIRKFIHSETRKVVWIQI